MVHAHRWLKLVITRTNVCKDENIYRKFRVVVEHLFAYNENMYMIDASLLHRHVALHCSEGDLANEVSAVKSSCSTTLRGPEECTSNKHTHTVTHTHKSVSLCILPAILHSPGDFVNTQYTRAQASSTDEALLQRRIRRGDHSTGTCARLPLSRSLALSRSLSLSHTHASRSSKNVKEKNGRGVGDIMLFLLAWGIFSSPSGALFLHELRFMSWVQYIISANHLNRINVA